MTLLFHTDINREGKAFTYNRMQWIHIGKWKLKITILQLIQQETSMDDKHSNRKYITEIGLKDVKSEIQMPLAE